MSKEKKELENLGITGKAKKSAMKSIIKQKRRERRLKSINDGTWSTSERMYRKMALIMGRHSQPNTSIT